MSTYNEEEEDYSLLNKIKKYGFIVFNILMIAWIAIAYFAGVAEENGVGEVGEITEDPAFGAGVGLMYIGIIWLVGNVILGLIAWYLKSKTPDTMHTTNM